MTTNFIRLPQVDAGVGGAGVPCFVKQLGSLVSGQLDHPDNEGYGVHGVRLNDRKGGDPAEWPEDLQGARQWPKVGGGA